MVRVRNKTNNNKAKESSVYLYKKTSDRHVKHCDSNQNWNTFTSESLADVQNGETSSSIY